jgi:hypothetical protein
MRLLLYQPSYYRPVESLCFYLLFMFSLNQLISSAQTRRWCVPLNSGLRHILCSNYLYSFLCWISKNNRHLVELVAFFVTEKVIVSEVLYSNISHKLRLVRTWCKHSFSKNGSSYRNNHIDNVEINKFNVNTTYTQNVNVMTLVWTIQVLISLIHYVQDIKYSCN